MPHIFDVIANENERCKPNFFLGLGYRFTPYQRLRLYNGAPFSRLLRHAGDTEDVFSA